tara:strand:+ start:598 stop:1191 length:594 start_codon:yes stop_codon:yes gene_type:complete
MLAEDNFGKDIGNDKELQKSILLELFPSSQFPFLANIITNTVSVADSWTSTPNSKFWEMDEKLDYELRVRKIISILRSICDTDYAFEGERYEENEIYLELGYMESESIEIQMAPSVELLVIQEIDDEDDYGSEIMYSGIAINFSKNARMNLRSYSNELHENSTYLEHSFRLTWARYIKLCQSLTPLFSSLNYPGGIR